MALSGAILRPIEETRIITLFRRRQALIDHADAYGNGTTIPDDEHADEIMVRLFYNGIYSIEEEMMVTPCKPPGEFAAKMIVDTSRGRAFPDWEEGAIWIKARALIGGAP